MRRIRWFLPEAPDVLGMLRRQAEVTIAGVEALVAWTEGDATKAEDVRAHERRADAARHELQQALTTAFTTPMEPEDLFALSRGLDDVMDDAEDAVREAEVMDMPPDRALAEMARLLLTGVRALHEAFAHLGLSRERATEAAEAAAASQREVERAYRRAMGRLLEVEDLREVIGRRELYRRFSRISTKIVAVAERVWYAVLKAA